VTRTAHWPTFSGRAGERVARPFEVARALPCQGHGAALRQEKTAVKAVLEQVLGNFERLGALLWAETTNAEFELVRLRPRRASVEALLEK